MTDKRPLRAPEDGVVVTSRVRLARNYQDVPFVTMLNEQWAKENVRRASQAVKGGPQGSSFSLLRMAELTPEQRTQLVEHHLISYDLLKFSPIAATLLSTGQTVSVMINEEDHLRIQTLLPGMQLERAADMAFEVDDWLGAQDRYAFDSQWGYLTSCPTNTGTGMRASVMLHLPGLSATRQMGAILQSVSKLGLTVRGLYGEGSEAQGDLYQLSNQVTLGRTEDDMIKSLSATAAQVIERETTIRQLLLKRDPTAMEDRVMRSLGILKSARRLESSELMERYSDLRWAAGMGMISAAPGQLDKLMMDAQPASVSVLAGGEMTSEKRDEARARIVREALKDISID